MFIFYFYFWNSFAKMYVMLFKNALNVWKKPFRPPDALGDESKTAMCTIFSRIYYYYLATIFRR